MAAPGGAQARPMTSPLTWDRVSLWFGIAGLIATAIIFLIATVLRGIAEGRGRSSALLTGADIAVMALFLPLAFLSIVGVISGIIGRKQAVTLEQRVRGARGILLNVVPWIVGTAVVSALVMAAAALMSTLPLQ